MLPTTLTEAPVALHARLLQVWGRARPAHQELLQTALLVLARPATSLFLLELVQACNARQARLVLTFQRDVPQMQAIPAPSPRLFPRPALPLLLLSVPRAHTSRQPAPLLVPLVSSSAPPMLGRRATPSALQDPLRTLQCLPDHAIFRHCTVSSKPITLLEPSSTLCLMLLPAPVVASPATAMRARPFSSAAL